MAKKPMQLCEDDIVFIHHFRDDLPRLDGGVERLPRDYESAKKRQKVLPSFLRLSYLQEQPLVWINGFPGVGKLTIARELVKFYEQQDVVLIDNHQLIDPVAAKWKRDDPEYYTERRRERLRALGRWVLPAEECQRLVVFTDCRSDDELGTAVGKEYEQAAAAAAAASGGRVFIPILLLCEEVDNLQRATSTERQGSGTTKLTDLEVVRQLRAQHTMLTFDLPTQLTLDISMLSVAEAALKLYEHIARFDET
ncbi:Putative P-loop containing nucleoside triphosphate hydrolase [Septoria linicola]|uniref:P-loop containing nucleoside triphosphate hydrolase n=1 Tax=Septoria linicola TaxID=215465 RepID=A0A9Q9AXU5_9PEZI|nr:Putative P-loop containing nucleoside triphosphate hydrolase [Septoria linicola]